MPEIFLAQRTPPGDPESCLDDLVTAGLLTRFQAGLLRRGKHRGFLLGDFKVQKPLGVLEEDDQESR